MMLRQDCVHCCYRMFFASQSFQKDGRMREDFKNERSHWKELNIFAELQVGKLVLDYPTMKMK